MLNGEKITTVKALKNLSGYHTFSGHSRRYVYVKRRIRILLFRGKAGRYLLFCSFKGTCCRNCPEAEASVSFSGQRNAYKRPACRRAGYSCRHYNKGNTKIYRPGNPGNSRRKGRIRSLFQGNYSRKNRYYS